MERQKLDKKFWMEKREIVNNFYSYNDEWEEIINRFQIRVEDFYFDPIDNVKDPNKLKGEGFTILTIQCALIEMFAAFKSGKIYKYDKKRDDPNYTYKHADECFISFLYSEEIFENHFYTIQEGRVEKDKPFSAKEFYDNVRCGLMHEARTKGDWVINAKQSYSGADKVFITKRKNNNISVDRTILNVQLKKYFSNYLSDLSSNDHQGEKLRRLFARKLDHLYDIPQDINYNWWDDY